MFNRCGAETLLPLPSVEPVAELELCGKFREKKKAVYLFIVYAALSSIKCKRSDSIFYWRLNWKSSLWQPVWKYPF